MAIGELRRWRVRVYGPCDEQLRDMDVVSPHLEGRLHAARECTPGLGVLLVVTTDGQRECRSCFRHCAAPSSDCAASAAVPAVAEASRPK